MDPRLLDYYNRELQYLRELGGEFAKQFPKIAGRLGLDAFACADPYVERLLEGFAFLAARVQLKIDAEFPRFTEHLLEMVYPHYLAPTPSMAIVRLEPSLRHGTLVGGYVLPRGTVLKSKLGKREQTRCVYRTAHEVSLFPIELIHVSHSAHVGDLGQLNLNSQRPIRGALRLRFRTTDGSAFSDLSLDNLPLFVHGPGQTGMRLYELLHAGAVAAVVRAPGATEKVVELNPITPRGFDDDDALLPYGPKSFQGYRLLQEYFALPSRFMFAELRGLSRGARRCAGPELEVVVLVDRHDPVLESTVAPSHLSLFCTPVINLFPRTADRIHLSDSVHEYRLIPDRTRPLDLEVHSVTRVAGFGIGSEVAREFSPFYSSRETSLHDETPAYYTLHREAAVPATRQRRSSGHAAYSGSEVSLALVDGNQGPYHPDLRQLSVDTLCTNRDLPSYMAIGQGTTDFQLESGAPVEATRCLVGPTAPRASRAWGSTAWRLVSHLSLNHLSLTDAADGKGAAGLREMLQLYGDLAEPSFRRQLEGIRRVSSAPVTRRLPGERYTTFARGLEVRLECDETAFEGTSVFLLGAVLDRFFAKYASINSFTETVLQTLQRGEIMRWPTRIGRRPVA